MYQLEERILFDGAAAVDLAAAQQEHQAQEAQAQAQAQAQPQADAATVAPEQNQTQNPHETAPVLPADTASAVPSSDTASADHSSASLSAPIDASNPGQPATTHHVNVLVVSDSIENADALFKSANSDTIVVHYNEKATTGKELLQEITDALHGEKADSIGFVTDKAHDGSIKIFSDGDTSEKTLSTETQQKFWNGVEGLLAEKGKVNIFASDLASTANGRHLVDSLAQITDHQVAASTDVTGDKDAGGNWELEYVAKGTGSVDLIEEYFTRETIQSFDHRIENPTEIAFIDSSVRDIDTILKGIGDQAEIVYLNHDHAFEQITSYLQGRTDVDAIHLVSDGTNGEIYLGNETVNSDFIAAHHDELASWGKAMAADGDIHIYGCDLAKDQIGKDLVNQISIVTGADVAASTDRTGVAGNWNLEFTTGEIQTAGFVIGDYAYNLKTLTVKRLDDYLVTNPYGINETNLTLREALLISVSGDDIVFADYTVLHSAASTTPDLIADWTKDGHIFIAPDIYHSDSGTINNVGGYNLGTQQTIDVTGFDGTIEKGSNVTIGGDSYKVVWVYGNTKIMISAGTVKHVADGADINGIVGGLVDTLSIRTNITIDGNIVTPSWTPTGATAATPPQNNAVILDAGSSIRGIYIDSQATVDPLTSITTGVDLKNIIVQNGRSLSTDNAPAAGNGGGFYISNMSSVSMIDVDVSGSTADYGGGIYNAGILKTAYILPVPDGGHHALMDIYSNTSNFSGGGIFNAGTSNITSQTFVYGNIAGENGGGIYNAGNITITGAVAIYNNTTAGDGGGIYSDNGNISLNNISIDNNHADTGNGGGIYIFSNYEQTAPIHFTGIGVSGNSAIDGAGIYLTNAYTTSSTINVFELEWSDVTGNIATGNGGGMALINNAGNIAIQTVFGTTSSYNLQSNISSNSAGYYGAGVYIENCANVTMDFIKMTYNGNSSPPFEGGAIYVKDSGTITLTDMEIAHNSATYGGGIYYDNSNTTGSLNVQRSNISNNNASYGGGIYQANGTLVLINDTLAYNGTDQNTFGGAIYMDYGTLNISLSTMAYNKGIGAAIYILGNQDNTSNLSVNNTIVYNLDSEFIGITPKIKSQIYIPELAQRGTINFSTTNNIYSHYYKDLLYSPLNSLDNLGNVNANRLIGYDSTAVAGHEGDKSTAIQSNLYLDDTLMYAANYRTMALAILSQNSWAIGNGSGGNTYDQRGNARGTTWTWNQTNQTWTKGSGYTIGAFEPIFHTEVNSNGDDSQLWYCGDPNAHYFDLASGGSGLTLREAIYWIDTRATLKTYKDPIALTHPLAGEYDSRYVGFNSTYFAVPVDGSVNPNNTIQLKYGQIEIGGRWNNWDSTDTNRDVAVGYMIRNADGSVDSTKHDNTLRAKDDPNRITVLAGDSGNTVAVNRLFMNTFGSVLALNNLTISGGVGEVNSTQNSSTTNGGGIWNQGDLTLTDMVVKNSTSSGGSGYSGGAPLGGKGGGIYNIGTAQIYDSSILNNTATAQSTATIDPSPNAGQGGGIWNGATMTIDRSQINGNTANGSSDLGSAMLGGGIYNQATLTIERSEISGNTVSGATIAKNAVKGAGIYNSSTLNIANCTIAENTLDTTTVKIDYAKGQTWGSYGSGIYNGGSIISYYNTIVNNKALVTDGTFWNPLTLKAVNLESMAAFYNADGASLKLSNSILTENKAILKVSGEVWQRSDLYVRTAGDVSTAGDNGKYNIIGAYNTPRVEQTYKYFDPSTVTDPTINTPVYYELTYNGTTPVYTPIYEYVAQTDGTAVNTGFDWGNFDPLTPVLHNKVGFFNLVAATGAPTYVSVSSTTGDFLLLHPLPTQYMNAITVGSITVPFIYTPKLNADGSPDVSGIFIKITGFDPVTNLATFVEFNPLTNGGAGTLGVGLYTKVGAVYFPYTIGAANAAYSNDLYSAATPGSITIIMEAGHTPNDPGIIPDTSNMRYGLVDNLNIEYTLNYNGSLTRSLRVLSGSVAMDTGIVIANPGGNTFHHLDTDQRGVDRGLLGAATNRGSFDYIDTITVRSAFDSSTPRVGFDFTNYKPLWDSSTLTLREAVMLSDDGSHIVFKDTWQINGSTYIDPAAPVLTGTLDNIGGYGIGTTTINIDNLTAGVAVGSYIKIAGDPNYHKVLSTVVGATSTSVTFSTALVNAVADNVVVSDYNATTVANELNASGNLIINLVDGKLVNGVFVSGELLVNRSITIDGIFQWNLVDSSGNIQSHHLGGISQLNAGANSRIFNVKSAVVNTLSTVGISNFTMTGTGTVTGSGGGIFSSANLWLDNVTIQNCKVIASSSGIDGLGGGIYSDQGYLQMIYSTISGNTANFGGGIFASGRNVDAVLSPYVLDVGHLLINGGMAEGWGGCSIINNTANNATNGSGGGIYLLSGNANIIYSTLGGNKTVSDGGGIYVATGALSMTNSTVANNTAGRHGGGIASNSLNTLNLNYSTIANNQSGWTILGAASGNPFATGGGIYMNSGTLNLTNSIVAQNFCGKFNDNTNLGDPTSTNPAIRVPAITLANQNIGIHDDLFSYGSNNLTNSVYGAKYGTLATDVNNKQVPFADWSNFSTTKLDSKLTDNGGRAKTVYVFDSSYFRKAVGGAGYDQTQLENFTDRITSGAYENSVDKVLYYFNGEITKGRDGGSHWVSANGISLTEADGVLNANNTIFVFDDTQMDPLLPVPGKAVLNYSWTINGPDWIGAYSSHIALVNNAYLTVSAFVAGTTTSLTLNGQIVVNDDNPNLPVPVAETSTLELQTSSLASTKLSVIHTGSSDTTVIYNSANSIQTVLAIDAIYQQPMDYDNLTLLGKTGTNLSSKNALGPINVHKVFIVGNGTDNVKLNVQNVNGSGNADLNILGPTLHNFGQIVAANIAINGTSIDDGGNITAMQYLDMVNVTINSQKTISVGVDLTMNNVTITGLALPLPNNITTVTVSGDVYFNGGTIDLTNVTITAGSGKKIYMGNSILTIVNLNGNVTLSGPSNGKTVTVIMGNSDIVATGVNNIIYSNGLDVSGWNWVGGRLIQVTDPASGSLKIDIGAQNLIVSPTGTTSTPSLLTLGLDKVTVASDNRFELVTAGTVASGFPPAFPTTHIDGTLALSGKINLDNTFINIVKPVATLELGGTITIPGNFITDNSLSILGTAKITAPAAITIRSVFGNLSVGTASTFTGNTQDLTLIAATTINLGNVTGVKTLTVTAGTDITLANSITVAGDLAVTAGGTMSAGGKTLSATGNITFGAGITLQNITVLAGSAKIITFNGNLTLSGNTTIGSIASSITLGNTTNVSVTNLNNNIVTKSLNFAAWTGTISVVDVDAPVPPALYSGALNMNISTQALALTNATTTSTATTLTLGLDRLAVSANNQLALVTTNTTNSITAIGTSLNIHGTLSLNGKIDINQANFTIALPGNGTLELGGTITIKKNTGDANATVTMPNSIVFSSNVTVDPLVTGTTTITSTFGSITVGSNQTSGAKFTGSGKALVLDAAGDITLGNISGINSLTVVCGDTNQDMTPDDITKNIFLNNSITVAGTLAGTGDVTFKSLNAVQVQKAFTSSAMTTLAPTVITAGTTFGTITSPGFVSVLAGSSELQLSAGSTVANSSNIGTVNMSNSLTFAKGGFASGNITLTVNGSNLFTKANLNVTGNIDIKGNGKLENSAALTVSGDIQLAGGASTSLLNNLASGTINTSTIHLLDTTFAGTINNIGGFGAVSHAGGYGIGTTTVAVNGFSGTIAVGSYVSFAGDLNYYKVASTVGGTTPTSITFTSGLLVAAADTTAITRVIYTGTATISVTGFTGPISVGSFVTIVGDATNHRVLSVLGGTGATTSITLSEGLKSPVAANAAITVHAPASLTNAGTMTATGAVSLVGGNLTNSKTFNAQSITNTFIGDLTNSNFGNLTNSGSGVGIGMTVTNNITLVSTGALNNTGTISAGIYNLEKGNLTTTVSLKGDTINFTGIGSLVASGTVAEKTALAGIDINLVGGNFTNSGTMTTVDVLNLTLNGALNNNSGTLTANTINMVNGTLTNKATLSANTITIAGTGNLVNTMALKEKGVGGGIDISLNGGSLTNTGTMTTVDALIFTGAGALNNNTGTLTANTIDMVNGTLTNKATLGSNTITFTGTGSVINSMKLQGVGAGLVDITLAGGSLTNTGTMTTVDALIFTGAGALNNNTGTLTANTISMVNGNLTNKAALNANTISITGTGNILNSMALRANTITLGDAILLGGGDLTNSGTGTIAERSAGVSTITLNGTGKTLTNSGTSLIIDNLILNESNLVSSKTLTVGGTLTLKGAGIRNITLSGAATVLNTVGTLDLQSNTVLSQGKLTVTNFNFNNVNPIYFQMNNSTAGTSLEINGALNGNDATHYFVTGGSSKVFVKATNVMKSVYITNVANSAANPVIHIDLTSATNVDKLVGLGTFKPVTVNGQYNGIPASSSTLVSSVNRVWTVTRTGTDASALTVKFFWNSATEQGSRLNANAKLFFSTGTSWGTSCGKGTAAGLDLFGGSFATDVLKSSGSYSVSNYPIVAMNDSTFSASQFDELKEKFIDAIFGTKEAIVEPQMVAEAQERSAMENMLSQMANRGSLMARNKLFKTDLDLSLEELLAV